ncbi:hypothetical protein BIV23_43880 [Streptomyces monashensis]|uniref:Uncharacterized protein n=2 Tax=Streptomyces monashensis TaxID=1678012 RepID=A0A1S2NZJ6_9ACTN|nr:hypothetical protein BIV23_43880 [Streptomyces monashensis]
MDPTTSAPGAVPARRIPAYARALGHTRAVCDLGPAACGGGDPPGRRFVFRPDAAWVDALLAAVDAQV